MGVFQVQTVVNWPKFPRGIRMCSLSYTITSNTSAAGQMLSQLLCAHFGEQELEGYSSLCEIPGCSWKFRVNKLENHLFWCFLNYNYYLPNFCHNIIVPE